MKRIIQPISEFECELTSETSDASYEPNPYFRGVAKPNFELIKKSRCTVRYGAGSDDGFTLARLRQELKTPFDVANHLATIEEARRSQERLDFFSKLLDKAREGTIDSWVGMEYVEITDSHTLHARAEYRYNNGEIELVFPCDVGKPLIQKLNTETLTFEL